MEVYVHNKNVSGYIGENI